GLRPFAPRDPLGPHLQAAPLPRVRVLDGRRDQVDAQEPTQAICGDVRVRIIRSKHRLFPIRKAKPQHAWVIWDRFDPCLTAVHAGTREAEANSDALCQNALDAAYSTDGLSGSDATSAQKEHRDEYGRPGHWGTIAQAARRPISWPHAQPRQA